MSASILEESLGKYEELQKVIDQYKGMDGPLMPILHKAQQLFGCLPIDVQNYVAEALDIPMTDIYGVATFYSQFSLKPKGKFFIGVCLGTACYVRGSQKILDELSRELGIKVPDTTEDGRFTLEATRCLGACGLAPVLMVNDDVYGRLGAGDIKKIVNKYKEP